MVLNESNSCLLDPNKVTAIVTSPIFESGSLYQPDVSLGYQVSNVSELPNEVHSMIYYLSKISINQLHCKCFPHKNYSTGNYRVSAGFPCKNHRETLCILRGNPVIFTDCREIPMIITCMLQGSPATQGFPALSMGKKFAVYILCNTNMHSQNKVATV